jgi:hypothetical protein
MKSAIINIGSTPKSTMKRGMSSICRRTIHIPLNTIQAEFSMRIHKIMRFFFLLCSRRQAIGGIAFCYVILLGQCVASSGNWSASAFW